MKVLDGTEKSKLIDEIIKSYSRVEGSKFCSLVQQLRRARTSGYMSKADLIAVCNWKSPRARPLCQKNHSNSVIAVSRAAFSTPNEQTRMRSLVSLHGVSVPMASAILAAYNPRRYGVIDIRVWQALHNYGDVIRNEGGVNLTVEHWLEYLPLLRAAARRNGRTARDAEMALFEHHKDCLQEGTLYKTQRSFPARHPVCVSRR